MVKVYVTKGLGIGCHEEVAHAYEKSGAKAEIVHIKEILYGDKQLSDVQILNLCGGFLHGDILGAGMCAANELEHAVVRDGRRIKDVLMEFKRKGNIVYGQCNGYQVMVRTGLLPGNSNGKQTVTLTNNDCGNYRVDFVRHQVEPNGHFAFKGINEIYLWCRHAEGKHQFYSPFGSISKEEAEETRRLVNEKHVLLRFSPPYLTNGSVDNIAGMYDDTFLGHMAHTEVGIYISRDPRWPEIKDKLRRQGIKAADLTDKLLEGQALQVFRNIVNYFK